MAEWRPPSFLDLAQRIKDDKDAVGIGHDIDQAFQIAYRRLDSMPTFVDNETPRGIINGTNTIFTLAQAPNPSASLQLFSTVAGNTVLLRVGRGNDYSINNATLFLVVAPIVGTILQAYYRY